MNTAAIALEIVRCEREIVAMLSQPIGERAYLTTLGIEDWEAERRILEAMLPAVCPVCCPEVIARHQARPGRTCTPCSYQEHPGCRHAAQCGRCPDKDAGGRCPVHYPAAAAGDKEGLSRHCFRPRQG